MDLNPIPLGTVPAGPLVFTIQAVPFLTFEGKIAVSVEPTITLTQIATAGLQWHRESDFTNLSDYSFATNVQFDETVQVEASAELGAGLKPSFKLYGVVGPFLEARAYGGVALSVAPFPECPVSFKTFAGGDLRVGGEITVFTNYLRFTSNPVFYEVTLSDKTLACEEDETPPTIPTGLSASAESSTVINLDWQSSTDNVSVSAYEVWRRDSNFGRPQLVAQVPGTRYFDKGLQSENEYCYYIRATDIAGNRSAIPSNLSCATTLKAEDNELPSIPNGVTGVAASTATIDLTWEASSDNEGVSGYIVLDYTTGEEDGYIVGETEALTVAIKDLNPDTEYCHAVFAVDRRGNLSDASETVCTRTKPKAEAEWTAFIGCQAREFLLEEKLEIEEDRNSRVEFAGQGNDYNGTALSYIFTGIYDQSSSILSADINWSFEGNSETRLDRFAANLSTGDSGIVLMDQVRRTGCDAQIQFVRDSNAASVKTQVGTDPVSSNNSSLGLLSEF